MALYTAKSQGRNCAVGIVDVQVADADGLRAVEADFERAWSEGRVHLRIDNVHGRKDTARQSRARAFEIAVSQLAGRGQWYREVDGWLLTSQARSAVAPFA